MELEHIPLPMNDKAVSHFSFTQLSLELKTALRIDRSIYAVIHFVATSTFEYVIDRGMQL